MNAGKTGVGKSSTVNSILAETVAHVVVMQGPASRAQAISRTAAGFTLTLIDTPGVLEGDAVDGAVRKSAECACICYMHCGVLLAAYPQCQMKMSSKQAEFRTRQSLCMACRVCN